MQRVIDEMAKAKDDVERRLRQYIPEIIRECMAFGYLGKNFTFDVSDLSDRVNSRLITLSDAILDDIESRAKWAISLKSVICITPRPRAHFPKGSNLLR